MAAEDLRALFTRYFDEVTNKGNLEVCDEVFATTYSHHDPASPPEVIGGVEDVKFHVGALREAFPDIRFTVERMIAEEHKIVVQWTAQCTHTGDYFGIPATGRSATITGMNTWHVADGKAVEGWVNRDDLGLLQQLGVVPTPGA